MIRDHITRAHSAEADVATASRQQSMAAMMHGQRLVIGCSSVLQLEMAGQESPLLVVLRHAPLHRFKDGRRGLIGPSLAGPAEAGPGSQGQELSHACVASSARERTCRGYAAPKGIVRCVGRTSLTVLTLSVERLRQPRATGASPFNRSS